MARAFPPRHGRTHLAGGSDPIGFDPAGGYSAPIVLPILMGEPGNYQGTGWTAVRVDTSVRFGAVRTNEYSGHTAAVNDYLTINALLGPVGSIWGLLMTYKQQAAGGILEFSLASIETPNPNRVPPTYTDPPEGTFTDEHPTYVVARSSFDTYGTDADVNVNATVFSFRIGGQPGDVLTTYDTGANDDVTNYPYIDGGPGMYALKIEVTGKNASSSGYRGEISGLAWVRLTDSGYHGGA